MNALFRDLESATASELVLHFGNPNARWLKIAESTLLETPCPRYVAGAATIEKMESNFGHRTLRTAEPGCLVLKDAYAFDYGLAIKDGCLLLDKSLTIPSKEVGSWGYYTSVEQREDGRLDVNEPLVLEAQLARAVILLRRGDSIHGHWLLEVLPRALTAMKFISDDAVFLVAAHIHKYQVEMLEALGVPPEKLFRLAPGEAVRCDELWVPSVMHTNELWLHPFANETYNALISAVGSDPDQNPTHNERIFVSRASRSRDPRPLLNSAELERIAKRNGYRIIDPGAVPWRDQVKFFSRASKVVGLCGSGLHNTVFTGSDAHVCAIQPNQNSNFLQTSIATVRGHSISYLIGESLSAFDRRTWEGGYLVDPLLANLFLERLL